MKITVIAHPNSKKPRLERELLGNIHVYVGQPPIAGKANKAITEALAKYFNVRKSNVILLSGEKSKTKVFEIINP